MNCEKCGQPLSGGAYCENCGHTNEQPVYTPQQPVTPEKPAGKPENVVAGTVGALIGSAIGAAAIILLSQLGYVAAISGLILAICTLKGYELLGGKLSTKGIIISLVLIVVVPYLADRLDWAIVLVNEIPGVSLGEAFQAIPELVEEELIASEDYIGTLVKLYLFVALGAFSTIFTAFKSKK